MISVQKKKVEDMEIVCHFLPYCFGSFTVVDSP